MPNQSDSDNTPRRRLTAAQAAIKYLGLKEGQSIAEFIAEWKRLEAVFRESVVAAAAAELDALVLPDSDQTILYTLWKYAAPGDARAPVLLTGGPGVGKTFEVRGFGRNAGFGRFIEVGGHSGLESFDLQGQTLIDGDGAAFWKDGPFTEAFRFVGCSTEDGIEKAVADGRTALLLIDESHRIPTREREMFLTALQPETIRGVPCYKVRTGRPLESGGGAFHEETLYAPYHLLSIVATTNVGMEFDIEADCPAGRERWVTRYVNFDEDKFLTIVGASLRKRGFPSSLGQNFLQLYKALENAKSDNLLSGSLSLRTAARIIDNAWDAEDLGNTILEVGEIWVEAGITGEPLPEQLETLTTIVTECGFTIEPC